MDMKNIFDEQFEKVSEARLKVENIRAKLIESVLVLNESKRDHNCKQKELTECEVEISKLKSSNQELKVSLMMALIENEELALRKATLISKIFNLKEQVQSKNEESNRKLEGKRVDQICERYSSQGQLALVNKIHEAQRKLIYAQRVQGS